MALCLARRPLLTRREKHTFAGLSAGWNPTAEVETANLRSSPLMPEARRETSPGRFFPRSQLGKVCQQRRLAQICGLKAPSGLNPNSDVAGIAPASGVAGRAPAFRIGRGVVSPGVEKFLAPGVFREGAENSARGGRAPIPISEFGFKQGDSIALRLLGLLRAA